ncbi:MAG: hypothetical protein BGO26_01880 [Actinobacteria bacterium 69-20]|nr:glycerate kinase [Actinomycetota bacterium]OJV29035.1 MAG: hypothetical protein BGO26_01880 [Actinobacteria bacterium 69-20]
MTMFPPARVLAAPDKFRGTLTAPAAAAAIAAGVRLASAEMIGKAAVAGSDAVPVGPCHEVPLADGGEGTLDALGGANRTTTVTGPLGQPASAPWRIDGRRAVIEMALASGLELAGGAQGNDPMAATTRGTGELILAAIRAGARDILVGVGGSATTDGGAGALEVLAPEGSPSVVSADVTIAVCADVRTLFLDAATVFGPQKGASREQVGVLTARLERLRGAYRDRFGIDVQTAVGSGAAGGLAGGLVALGARIVGGFDAVAEAVGLDDAVAEADLVVTGEGRFDAASLHGKVVGGVIQRARARRLPVLVVCGAADPAVAVPNGVEIVPLVDRFGRDAAISRTAHCVSDAVRDWLIARY